VRVVTTTDVLRVLDAGCGRNLHLQYPGLDLRKAHVTGIDISQAALDKNPHAHRKILGDLQTYPLPLEAFDVVVCHDVLEHLPRPNEAVANMGRALRPGGELVISVSNPASFKGIVTKFTPFAFHLLVYKRGWFGYRYVDDPAYPPFKTFMRWSIRPSALERSLRELGFEQIDVRLEEHRALERFLPRRLRHSECRIRARKCA
jgi:SAM-dependent methyltransferase